MIDLPADFSYRVISRAGDEMDDGLILPGHPDGMGTFVGPDGTTILIRNHELNPLQNIGPWGKDLKRMKKTPPDKIFDRGKGKTPGYGGTTTLVYDTKAQKVVRQFLSLAGTHRNCAGGITPWNSWVTCEETVQKPGHNSIQEFDSETYHGYCFEVPATAEIEVADPVPLKAMGRFNHEAVAVHEASGIVYLTEDRHDGLLYRFLPKTPGRLQEGGRLQALVLPDLAARDTRNWHLEKGEVKADEQMKVEWIDLEDVDAPNDKLRQRGFKAGAAQFARGEGMWAGEDGIYFACTNGGKKMCGQIFRYRPGDAEGKGGDEKGTLELFIESTDPGILNLC